MRRQRPKSLVVEKQDMNSYESNSPRPSTTSRHSTHESAAPLSPSAPAATGAPAPSIRLLFSSLSRKDVLCLLLPALLSSIVAGGVAPFMTYVIGQSFNAFAQFPLTPSPPQSAKDALLHTVGISALELLGLAVGSIALGSLTSCLWIWTGERNVLGFRRRVYTAVAHKPIAWFDTAVAPGEGAGGMMATFARETDDVRAASSLSSGLLVQHLTTLVTCLGLAFSRSAVLTLVTLSSLPVLVFVQAISQRFAGPRLAQTSALSSALATTVERAVSFITTVKAFTATSFTLNAFSKTLTALGAAYRALNATWGMTSGVSQFVSMCMFVQAFWFGSTLVRRGSIEPGDVMAVFWACLIAASHVQMCIPQLISLAKGKFAAASLLGMIADEPPVPPSRDSGSVPSTPTTFAVGKSFTKMRPVRPQKFDGQIQLSDVSFAYPARSEVAALRDVNMFLPAGDLTFVVGGSGAGKSTIAQLVSGMYDNYSGIISIDDQDVRYLDHDWIRTNIACVSQTEGVVLEGKTMWENILMGTGYDLSAEIASFDELPSHTQALVVEATTIALMHSFILDLPEGFDTPLTSSSLSGGQKQRLAIARARVKDPAVLILDEPTSALDITSRVLVFEAIKRWRLPHSERDTLYSPSTVASSMHTAPRKTRTTIVVTHDLSHIELDDFVYVMRNGRVAEQGFRKDLEARNISTEARDSRSVVDDEFDGDGEFLRLREAQAVQSPNGSEPGAVDEGWERAKEELEDSDEEEEAAPAAWRAPNVFSGAFARPDSLAAPNLSKRLTRLKTMSNGWMLDAIADITAAPERAEAPRQEKEREKRKTTTSKHATYTAAQAARRRPSMHVSIPVSPPPAYDQVEYGYRRRRSLQFTPSSPTFVKPTHRTSGEVILDEDEKRRMEAASSAPRPTARPDRRNRNAGSVDIRVEGTEKASDEPPAPRPPGLFATLRAVYPDAPYKPLFLLGLFLCLANGAMTPVFSFFLSRLMFEVSTGSTDVGLINRVGGLVLGVTCLDGLLMGTKYFLMETLAGLWADRMRATAFANVLAQDKAWFDRPANTVSRIVQVLVKDAEDAKLLLSTVIGQMVVVTAMFGIGLLWALARGWELTLAGFAVAPVFMGVMAIQTRLVGECERRNRLAREQVSKGYYETISNIRAIRSMTYDDIFRQQFEKAAAQALKSGVRGALTEGCTGGIASGLIYFAEALLFYIGAVLIANGRYSYLRMVETLNLVVFTVTIGSQIMAFTAKISKATQATTQLNELGHLSPLDTTEAKGTECPALYGDINFRNVDFAYPERPDAPVLRDFTLRIKDGECVAIVGESGSGKSTVASLLQRLYEPQAGMISIGYHNIRHVDVDHLRHYLAVVSQHPQLWDASVRDNITYGTAHMPEFHILRAAEAARAQEFIMELPQGYDTMLGEDAARLSGGQKQRLQIARALARLGVHVGRGVLVLDECTSALDAESQRGVLEAIARAKEGRTTVMITHKLEAMQMCDRIVLLKDGQVCEEGTFEELMARRGVFASLARGGEWNSD
ncbi:P-loop containing nucleoside triphosphate hydrolase protein [Schizophyllum commune H4-8]|uniref:P-loop containing nucleoside triphosphate hydrolase protein n=1 Tax=Schizophyllum commune (strain H4-8 / FGSC 9210) TaxID=578458 RepID=D8QFN2_SCHCM|nr:P-loop containing nucleoside triphosphate hydrolase protein [Schizophyllum commune H4-8]KAI5887715.1 P-loop containing nucleoside triphosphate hydrolase protein [Schizophyllum commune H4-8]